jgi:hypothetical protein
LVACYRSVRVRNKPVRNIDNHRFARVNLSGNRLSYKRVIISRRNVYSNGLRLTKSETFKISLSNSSNLQCYGTLSRIFIVRSPIAASSYSITAYFKPIIGISANNFVAYARYGRSSCRSLPRPAVICVRNAAYSVNFQNPVRALGKVRRCRVCLLRIRIHSYGYLLDTVYAAGSVICSRADSHSRIAKCKI